MFVLNVRNAHEGLWQGLHYLKFNGLEQESRNGPVVRADGPVSTVYHSPMERVVFWPTRDANPFFHTYEALWMLAGRNDVRSVARYVKQMMAYSDDGVTIHDAYGYRWRKHFQFDQLKKIIGILKRNPLDRQCVLEMWDAPSDLDRGGKAVPCNLIATFQVDPFYKNNLNMVMFNRSNDIIWGTYGANAVHFGFLLEYVSRNAGFKPGTYTQISVNYHAYKDQYDKNIGIVTKYDDLNVPPFSYPRWIPMPAEADALIEGVLDSADNMGYPIVNYGTRLYDTDEWGSMMHRMMWAHQFYRAKELESALSVLRDAPDCDWTQAGKEWITRRIEKRRAFAELYSADTDGGV